MGSVYDEEVGSGGGKFLKIESGGKVRIRLVQDPIKFTKIFQEQETTRYACLVLLRDEEKKESRLAFYEMSLPVFRLVRALAKSEDWGNSADPETGYDMRIFREGSGLETKWGVTPIPAKPLSASDRELLAKDGSEYDVAKAFKLGTGYVSHADQHTGGNDDIDPFADE